MHGILVDTGHRCTELISFIEDISIEECFADNAHGEGDHLRIEVNDRAILPLPLEALSRLYHRLRIGGDMTWLKHRGHQFALVAMKLPFADEEAIATKCLMYELSRAKVIGMVNQDALHMFWSIKQNQGDWPQMQATNSPMLRRSYKEGQAILPHHGRQAPDQWKLTDVGKRLC